MRSGLWVHRSPLQPVNEAGWSIARGIHHRFNLKRKFSMKRITVLILTALMVICGASAAGTPSVTEPQIKNPQRVLLVGNSYIYYGDSLHNHLRRMVAAADPEFGKKLQYKSATIGGAWLDHHNIDWLTTPGQIGIKQPFELVILNENSAAALSDKNRERFLDAARAAAKTIQSRGGKLALYMSHAYVAPHKLADPAMIRKVEALYLQAGKEVNALVIPVGLAFEEAYKRHPEMKLHKSFDGSHPSMDGTYLAAATVYAAIYDRNPVGNTYDAYGEVDKATAAKLQAVAWDTVQRFYGR
jgi:hypothetical protein